MLCAPSESLHSSSCGAFLLPRGKRGKRKHDGVTNNTQAAAVAVWLIVERKLCPTIAAEKTSAPSHLSCDKAVVRMLLLARTKTNAYRPRGLSQWMTAKFPCQSTQPHPFLRS